MPHALRAPSVPLGLSEIAEEFKRLDHARRSRGLSLGEAGRYHLLVERLSDALDAGARQRRVDTRQFLRVPFRMTLTLRLPRGTAPATCNDFGGGGCSITSAEYFHLDDDVWLDGADVDGEHHPLHGRAKVVWARLSTDDQPAGYGLKFCIDA